ncbi:hypothetical protein JF546_09795 [Nitratireductor aquimarinus]|uniref:hypothetical protein n=1 Tax=Nitratireductor aquimarinus TaxID=889300 RepID=UPI001A8D5754|nr:hypothetical protein [Nitratireductor aquimarinus]MBN8243302.1 hypothetical protein [Nitratireductor aquimarinus]MBY6131203.1 hypothetical protein [Nitratireductor aquimarinus]MCA1302041.1 hypothetical protein [Nitratireductor aquimarinus]
MTPLLIKSFRAALIVAGNRIVSAAADGEVNTASANTDPSIGISDAMGAEAGRMVDLTQVGWAELKLGGTVSAGDPLTSDAEGRGVKAAPVAGTEVRVAAIAMADGELDEIIPVLVAPSVLATPV